MSDDKGFPIPPWHHEAMRTDPDIWTHAAACHRLIGTFKTQIDASDKKLSREAFDEAVDKLMNGEAMIDLGNGFGFGIADDITEDAEEFERFKEWLNDNRDEAWEQMSQAIGAEDMNANVALLHMIGAVAWGDETCQMN